MRLSSVQLFALLVLAGCAKEAPPPKPLAVEDAPATLEQVFQEPANASRSPGAQNSQVRESVNEAHAALAAKDYTRALFALQGLSGRSDLTDAQRDFVTRAMFSVHQALEQAANSGDQKAQQALDLRRALK